MGFKTIIAKTNANEELEFICYPKEKPKRWMFKNGLTGITQLTEEAKEWEQSAQVFKPINKDVGYRIIHAFIDEQGDNRRVDMVIADQSNLVKYIELKFNSESDLNDLELYAFYKSPDIELKTGTLNDNEIARFTNCPTCGSECKVEGDGTKYYVPATIEMQGDIWDDAYVIMSDYFEGKISAGEADQQLLEQFKITRLTK